MKATVGGRVLLVDDDETLLHIWSTILRHAGLTVDECARSTDALEMIKGERYDAIISDIYMPGADGIEVLKAARERDPSVPVVLITGSPTLDTAIAAVDHHAFRYIQKPFDMDSLINAVREAISERVAPVDVSAMSRRLDDALANLWVAYQPIVQFTSRSTHAYEALLRSSAAGVPGPMEILALAEKTHRLKDLGRAIRAKIADDLAPLPQNTLAFVNLHPSDLEDEELYRPDSPLAPFSSRVVLEITERASIVHMEDLDGHLRELRKLGYRVAVDDLGAGYAGLSTFAKVQPEFVKLDGSLVRNIHESQVQRVVVSSVMTLAHELRSSVIAECIETREELAALRALQVDLMQGFLFARPARPFVSVSSDLFGTPAAQAS